MIELKDVTKEYSKGISALNGAYIRYYCCERT